MIDEILKDLKACRKEDKKILFNRLVKERLEKSLESYEKDLDIELKEMENILAGKKGPDKVEFRLSRKGGPNGY